MNKLTHLDETGAARMVDVSAKDATERQAAAEAIIVLSKEAYEAAISGSGPKGDVLAAARIAGIMAAKKTSDLIPLCHPIAITKAGVDFEPLAGRHALRILATVKTLGQTGVEMEALTAASIAALTVYDMVKAVDRGAVIEAVRLVSKSGGKSGAYFASTRKTAPKLNIRKSETLMNEVAAPRHRDTNGQRDAFRAFMTAQRLRATEWAKQADIPVAQIYAYLTGKARVLAPETAKRLARAAGVREEDMFR
ncbi:MAG: cyclic pyranopterin monophosphate synthase MoaC [Proteobacteria bacterium]|nr:cyclic pyranopterin monophosphate synthase MoaC [Pseudomonadota bacterium]